jgi:hypothetical protein|tara:strand:+ start:2942 stop:3163 length:222 start_codon:yes stop_codon:yes gene_type:complete
LVYKETVESISLPLLKERGHDGVEMTPSGGLDYSKSNAFYEEYGVNPIVEIEYTGGVSQYKEVTGKSYTFKTW